MGRYLSPIDSRIVNDYNQDIQLGRMPGVSHSFTSSENPAAQVGVTENIWPQGGKLQYLSADTTMYISSSSAADTTQTIVQIGLNDNLEQIFGLATLGGQSQVALSSQFYRFFGCFNLGPTAAAGDVYVAESDTLTGGVPDTAAKIHIKMPIGVNLATNGTFTIPKGKTGYLFQLEGSIEKSKNAALVINNVDASSGLGYLVSPYKIYESSFGYAAKSGLGTLGEGAIIEPLVTTLDADTAITVNFTVNLVDT